MNGTELLYIEIDLLFYLLRSLFTHNCTTRDRFLFLPAWAMQRPPLWANFSQLSTWHRGPSAWALQRPPLRAPLVQPSSWHRFLRCGCARGWRCVPGQTPRCVCLRRSTDLATVPTVHDALLGYVGVQKMGRVLVNSHYPTNKRTINT